MPSRVLTPRSSRCARPGASASGSARAMSVARRSSRRSGLKARRSTAGWSYEKEAWFQPTAGARQGRPVLDQHGTRRLMMAAVLRRLADPAAPICSTGLAARHTALIEGIHRAAPIREFPREQVEWIDAAGPAGAIPHSRGWMPPCVARLRSSGHCATADLPLLNCRAVVEAPEGLALRGKDHPVADFKGKPGKPRNATKAARPMIVRMRRPGFPSALKFPTRWARKPTRASLPSR